MLKIAICDDQRSEQDHTVALLQDYFKIRSLFAAGISVFNDGQALLKASEEGTGFDVYILDVLMPGKNGIQIGEALRQMNRNGIIIYLTTSPDYAVDSYLTRAFFYLVKPVEKELLFDVLDRAITALRKRKSEATFVNTSSGLRSVWLDEILYVERVERFMRYYLSSGETVDTRTIRGSFREAAAPLLADHRFVLCGVSFVLGLHHVKSVEKNEVLLDSGSRISVSLAASGELKRAWMNYWLGGETI